MDASFCTEDTKWKGRVRSELLALLVVNVDSTGLSVVTATPGFQELCEGKSEISPGTPLSEVLREVAPGQLRKLFSSPEGSPEGTEGSATAILCQQSTVHVTLRVLSPLEGLGVIVCQSKKSGAADDQSAKQHEAPLRSVGFASIQADNASPVFKQASAKFLEITGYKQEELEGQTVAAALLHPYADVRTSTDFLLTATDGLPSTASLLCQKKDGTPFFGLLTLVPLPRPREESLNSQAPERSASSGEMLLFVADVTARPQTVGRYVVGKVIGKGSFGVVHLAKDSVTGERVAVKMINSSKLSSIGAIEQLQDEMTVLSALHHPNIVRLRELHYVKPTFYFVMDLATGGSLAEYLALQPWHRLPEDRARHIFRGILSALDYCHRRRVIHRDLKPENILLCEGEPKVSDFGLAGMTTPLNATLNSSCGTPEFCAPEVLRGSAYGPAVDIWSLGVILYEMLQGHPPFRGGTVSDLADAVCKGCCLAPSNASAECQNLIGAMLTIDPKERASVERIQKHAWLHAPEMFPPLRDDSRQSSLEAAPELASFEIDRQQSVDKRMRSSLRLVLPPLDPSAEEEAEKTFTASPGDAKSDKGAGNFPNLATGDVGKTASLHASLRRGRNSLAVVAGSSTGPLQVDFLLGCCRDTKWQLMQFCKAICSKEEALCSQRFRCWVACAGQSRRHSQGATSVSQKKSLRDTPEEFVLTQKGSVEKPQAAANSPEAKKGRVKFRSPEVP